MYKALYREYRPEIFSQMLGQEHIVRILRSQLKTGSVSHAYLFCGTRGTGKTTTARILAKGVNCIGNEEEIPCGNCENCRAIQAGTFFDLIEIDAASNNGVENIRELRETVNYAPAAGKFKVYIIDEVHMLSQGAFNALLKTLEEPPENVVFILCTTEPEKLPPTILSRCMRMDFRRVSEQELEDAFKKICLDRGVEMEESAMRLIVSGADGSVRDGLTLLDKCIAGRSGVISRDEVLDAMGAVGEEAYIELTQCALDHDISAGLAEIDRFIRQGRDARQILQGWMEHYRKLMMTKFITSPEDVLNLSLENVERVRQQSNGIDLEQIHAGIIETARTLTETRTSGQPRILLEVCFVKLASMGVNGPLIPQKRSAPMFKETGTPGATGGATEKMQAEANTLQSVSEQQGNGSGHSEAAEQPPGQSLSQMTAPPTDAEAAERDRIREIWDRVLEKGTSQNGSFWLAAAGTEPVKMNENEFVITAQGMAVEAVEMNRRMAEELLAEFTGSPKRLIMRTGDEEETTSPDAEKLAEAVSNQFGGIRVDIE